MWRDKDVANVFNRNPEGGACEVQAETPKGRLREAGSAW
jgi:hypothetical protein